MFSRLCAKTDSSSLSQMIKLSLFYRIPVFYCAVVVRAFLPAVSGESHEKFVSLRDRSHWSLRGPSHYYSSMLVTISCRSGCLIDIPAALTVSPHSERGASSVSIACSNYYLNSVISVVAGTSVGSVAGSVGRFVFSFNPRNPGSLFLVLVMVHRIDREATG